MFRLVALLGACLLLAGCAHLDEQRKEARLQRVAKDWSLVIRASQVIPVYPLTQDMQPGDIFLVQTPVEDQVASYRERGFLPLDYLLYRLQPDYHEFYRNPAVAVPPGRWGMGSVSDQAPRAGFPSYSFEVSSGAGLELALPVSAVSTGLNFLGASAARGAISLRDAQTYGLDIDTLYEQVRARVEQDAGLARLIASFAPSPPGPWPWSTSHTNYLRVVNRVFLVRSMDVSLQATARHSAGLTASLQPGLSLGSYDATLRGLNRSLLCGQSVPGRILPDVCRTTAGVPLPSAPTTAAGTAEAAVDGVTRALPDLASQALASGGVSVQSASSSSISLREDFKVPVVVGYHGFDIPIGRDGRLGAPIPTYSLLNGGTVSDLPLAVFSQVVIARKTVEENLERLSADQALQALDVTVQRLGPAWQALWQGRTYRATRPVDAWRAVLTRLAGSSSEAQVMAALSAGCTSQGLSGDCSASR